MRKQQKRIKIGETYGAITVASLSKSPSCHNLKIWNCECKKCGALFEYSGHQVYKYTHDGCPECRKKDITESRIQKANCYANMLYGNLKILEFSHFDKRKMPVVKCLCLKCNNISYIALTKIIHGESSQCANCTKQNLKKGKELMLMAHVQGTCVVSIQQGRTVNKNSSTKATGVSYIEKCNKYRAYICFQRKQYHLGLFEKIDDAIAARKTAEKEIYGEFLEWYSKKYPTQWAKLNKGSS